MSTSASPISIAASASTRTSSATSPPCANRITPAREAFYTQGAIPFFDGENAQASIPGSCCSPMTAKSAAASACCVPATANSDVACCASAARAV